MTLLNQKLAFRSLYRNKLLSSLNIAGLTEGLAVAIIIFNFSFHEFRADKHYNQFENIYLVLNKNSANVSYNMASLLSDQVSGIKYVSMVDSWSRNFGFILKYKDNRSIKSDVIFPDANFTRIFNFPLVSGSLENALAEPGSVILTESESNRLFNDNNPIGKILSLRGDNEVLGNSEVEVKAVIKDFPENSNLQFKAAVSHLTTAKMMSWIKECLWTCSNPQNYVLLEKGQDPKVLASQMNKQLKPLIPKEIECDFTLLPYKDVYFSNIGDYFKHGNLKLIYTLCSIALLILLIAAINYINLSMAGSVKRLTEVGVKKIVGARPKELIIQFLRESAMISFIAMILGVLLAYLVTPSLSKTFAIHLPAIPLSDIRFWLLLILCSALTGMIAGLIPSLSFNNFRPVSLISGRSESGNHSILKRGLIIIQFIVAIILIICTLTVTKQLDHLRNTDIGFVSDNIINIKLSPELKPDVLKDKLQHNPGVKSVSFSLGFPGNMQQHYRAIPMVISGVENKVDFDAEYADASYVKLMGLNILQGRNFSDSLKSDIGSSVLLNEAAVKAFGLQNPLESVFQLDGTHKIIGIIKDFNFESLHNQIKPLVIFCTDRNLWSLNVKLSNGNFNAISKTLTSIGQAWSEVSPNFPFEFKFIDQEIENFYKSEMMSEKIFRYGSLFAIFISCLGLFGLVLGSTEQRKKEISIRRVNGARIGEVLLMLNKDFVKCIGIAFVVATPVAWFVMHRWLENFAYKTGLSWWIFTLAGFMALGIALLTVSWQSWKAATRNPVEALRYE